MAPFPTSLRESPFRPDGYDEGVAAATAGVLRSANPHVPGSQDFNDWNCGFEDAGGVNQDECW